MITEKKKQIAAIYRGLRCNGNGLKVGVVLCTVMGAAVSRFSRFTQDRLLEIDYEDKQTDDRDSNNGEGAEDSHTRRINNKHIS